MSLGVKFNSVYLKPGELCISHQPMKVTTVLGSCVAATMFHQKLGIGAICHAMQPVCRYESPSCHADCAEKNKYVSCVISVMIERLKRLSVNVGELEVKLFGGAIMLGNKAREDRQKTIGQQNIEAALRAFETKGIHLRIAEVGGEYGRKIIFNSKTGEVLLKRIWRSAAMQIPTPKNVVLLDAKRYQKSG
jgi:chemotaxis protein CheD